MSFVRRKDKPSIEDDLDDDLTRGFESNTSYRDLDCQHVEHSTDHSEDHGLLNTTTESYSNNCLHHKDCEKPAKTRCHNGSTDKTTSLRQHHAGNYRDRYFHSRNSPSHSKNEELLPHDILSPNDRGDGSYQRPDFAGSHLPVCDRIPGPINGCNGLQDTRASEHLSLGSDVRPKVYTNRKFVSGSAQSTWGDVLSDCSEYKLTCYRENFKRLPSSGNGLTVTEYGASASLPLGSTNDAIDDDFIDADIPKSNPYFDKESSSEEDEVLLRLSNDPVQSCKDLNGISSSRTAHDETPVPGNLFSSISTSNGDAEVESYESLCDSFSQCTNITSDELTLSDSVDIYSTPDLLPLKIDGDSMSNGDHQGKQLSLENSNFDKNNLNVRNDVKSVIPEDEVSVISLDDDNLYGMGTETERSLVEISHKEAEVNESLVSPKNAFEAFKEHEFKSTTNEEDSGIANTNKTGLSRSASFQTTTTGCLDTTQCNKNEVIGDYLEPEGQEEVVTYVSAKIASKGDRLESSSDEDESGCCQPIRRDKEGRKILPKPSFTITESHRLRPPSVEVNNQMARLRAHIWKQKGKCLDYKVVCTGIPHYLKVPRSQRYRDPSRDLEREDESSTDEEYYEPVPSVGSKEFLRYHYRRRALAEEKGDQRTCECHLCKLQKKEYIYNVTDYDKPWPDYIETIIMHSKAVDSADKNKPGLTKKDSRWSMNRCVPFILTDAHSITGFMERKFLVDIDGFEEKHGSDRRHCYYHMFIWSEDEVRAMQVNQIGASACGPTAALNVLKAFGYEMSAEEIQNYIPVKRRLDKAPIPDYLLSRSCAGTTAQDIVEGIEKATNGEIKARFFSTFPERNFKIQEFVNWWLSKGAACILTMNLQRGRMWGRPVPDAWHHQMVYGVNSSGIHLTNPVEYMSDFVVHNKLNSDSVLLVRGADVISRWSEDGHELLQLMDIPTDPRWRDMNVLGQVINVMRAQQHPYSRPVNVPSHISIPAVYKAGVSVFIPRVSLSYHALLMEPELPILRKEDGPVYEYDEFTRELTLSENLELMKRRLENKLTRIPRVLPH